MPLRFSCGGLVVFLLHRRSFNLGADVNVVLMPAVLNARLSW